MGSTEMDAQAKRFATTPAKARIYVYRNSFMGKVFNQQLLVNGADAGSIAGYSFMPLEVAPGKYKLFAKSENETTLDLDVQAGKNYFVKLEGSMGVFTYRSSLTAVSEDEAKKEILDECKLVTSSAYPLSS
jgi:hypothetical protein